MHLPVSPPILAVTLAPLVYYPLTIAIHSSMTQPNLTILLQDSSNCAVRYIKY